jgi:hypothetical protein
MPKKVIIFLFICNLFLGCQKDLVYTVHSDFEIYVERFIEEAKLRGKTFNFHQSGLIIAYGDNGNDDWAGLCHYETPIRIEIDREYWNSIGKENDGERKQEGIIFHELGHGFLKRQHLNDRLPNGDWKSIMHGKVEGQSGNVNYRGFRKKYYVDELFKVDTPVPDWAVFSPTFSQNSLVSFFADDFVSNRFGWFIGSNSENQASISNGMYTYKILVEQSFFQAKKVAIPNSSNFDIELRFKFLIDDPAKRAGIVFCGSSSNNLYYYYINNYDRVIIGNYLNYSWYIELVNVKAIHQNDFNKMTIRKVNDLYYFYVNDVFVYHTDLEGSYGNLFGFHLDGKSSIMIDNFEVNQLVQEKSTKLVHQVEINDSTIVGINKELIDQLFINY